MFTIRKIIIAILLQTVHLTAMQNATSSVFTQDKKPQPALQQLLKAFNITAQTPEEIVKATQKEWLRAAGKERWEAQDPYAARKDELMPLFKQIGIIEAEKPAQNEYDYVLILGALLSRAQMRTDHAIELWKKGIRFKEVVILGSERPLDPQLEQADFGMETPKNEYEMMLWVYSHADMPKEMRHIKVTTINTPNTIDAQGKIKRANTKDTIESWLKTNPRAGSCLIISNQPHVSYQKSVTQSYLPAAFKVDAAGPVTDPATRVTDYLDALARWIYQEHIIFNQLKI